MRLQNVALLVVAVVLSNSPRLFADQSETPDLAQLQGLWERKTGEDVPGMKRATKEIRGNHETITYYGEEDKLLRAHEVDFRLDRRDGLHIFTFSNWVATEGPDKGHKAAGEISYVYRVDENTFCEVWGFLPGQEQRSPRIMMWVRKLPLDPITAEEQNLLQGKWHAGEASSTASRELAGEEFTIHGDDFAIHKAGHNVLSGVIRIHASATPKAIDFIITHSPNGLKTGQVIRGIFEMKGPELRVCSSAPNHPRPHEFSVREGSTQTLLELRKAELKP